MEKQTNNSLTEIADYYAAKLAEHGESPRGVDWNGEKSQIVRFEQLVNVIDLKERFSVNDLGCGYGAFYDYLVKRFSDFFFNGWDISEDMIRSAQKCHTEVLNASFVVSEYPLQKCDYGIASGIFNVRLKRSDSEWLEHIKRTIDILDKTSLRGFAFNCLTSYSDPDKTRDYLYYCDPCVMFDLCKTRYSRHVALLHDYGLYEFTILVKKYL